MLSTAFDSAADLSIRFLDLGRLGFRQTLEIQERTVADIAAGRSGEVVYLVEHPHVFTLGRRGDASNLLRDTDFDGLPLEVLRINRGGDITYHGPGQLVGYPHLDLRRRGRDLHRYLRGLEEVLIRTAAAFGVAAERRSGLTGVWTDSGKLASIGVGVRNWITMHGFALNVSTDLRYFGLVNPCGIPGCPVTSLAALSASPPKPAEVRTELSRRFREVFEA